MFPENGAGFSPWGPTGESPNDIAERTRSAPSRPKPEPHGRRCDARRRGERSASTGGPARNVDPKEPDGNWANCKRHANERDEPLERCTPRAIFGTEVVALTRNLNAQDRRDLVPDLRVKLAGRLKARERPSNHAVADAGELPWLSGHY